ncbi:MAG: c-type cytochrome domain-containing protein, partial [Planctomycetia bacterium]
MNAKRYAVAVVLCATAAAEPPKYNDDVVPVLNKYCVGCHTSDDPAGELVMETFADLKKGGKHGPAFVAGKSAESRMIGMVTGAVKPKMPPKDEPQPSDSEVAVIRAWIDAGAAPPSGAPSAPARLPKVAPPAAPPPSIHAVALAPQGVMAVGRYDSVQLVDPATGFIVRTLDGPPGPANGVRFTADGSKVLAAGGAAGVFGEAVLWNAADGKRVRTFRGLTDSLYAAEMTADGKILAVAGYDKDVLLFDAADGKLFKTLVGHNDAVYALSFRPDGRILASSSGDRTIKLWEVATGARLDTFSQPTKEQYTVQFSRDGKKLYAGGVDNRIRQWEVSPTGKEGSNRLVEAKFAHDRPIVRLELSLDGRVLASSGEDRRVKLWDLEPLRERAVLETQPDWAAALAFTADGKSLAVGRFDGALAFYDAAAGAKQKDVAVIEKPPAPPEATQLRPRGVERGKPTVVVAVGKNLTNIVEVKTNHADLKATARPGADESRLEIDLTPGAGLPRGSYTVEIVTRGGATKPLAVFVDDLPQSVEAEPNDGRHPPNVAVAPLAQWGEIDKAGDVDSFAVRLTAGKTAVFELAASAIGSKLQGVLTLTKPD